MFEFYRLVSVIAWVPEARSVGSEVVIGVISLCPSVFVGISALLQRFRIFPL